MQHVLRLPAALTPEGFTQDILRRINAANPQDGLSINPDEPLVLKGGQAGTADERTINLHRVYQYCLNATLPDCDAARQEFVAKIMIKPPAPKAETLRLIVRGEDHVAYVRQMLEKSGKLLEPRRIGDDLYAILVFDAPDTISVATADMINDLKLTPDAAWLLAMRQSKALLPPLPNGKKLAKAPTAYSDKEYLGSLLADIDGWRVVAAAAGPDMFVTVVADQFVFVGLMPDGSKLDGFKQSVAEDCRGQQRCISDKIYRFRDGLWKVAD